MVARSSIHLEELRLIFHFDYLLKSNLPKQNHKLSNVLPLVILKIVRNWMSKKKFASKMFDEKMSKEKRRNHSPNFGLQSSMGSRLKLKTFTDMRRSRSSMEKWLTDVHRGGLSTKSAFEQKRWWKQVKFDGWKIHYEDVRVVRTSLKKNLRPMGSLVCWPF